MTRMPNVLICGPSREAISGVSTHLNQVLRSSIAQKYSVAHFQVGSEGRNEVIWQKALRLLGSPLVLIYTIFRRRIAIVHLNTSMDRKAYWRDTCYLIAAKLLGCRVVNQIHGGALPKVFVGDKCFFQSFLRWTLSIPDVIVVLSNIERDAYGDFGGPRNIQVIPNAIDLDEYRHMRAKEYCRSDVRLGFIGRLTLEKGIREIVEALSILQQSGIQGIRLAIAGSGPFENELIRLIESKSLLGSVELLGPVFGREKIAFWRDTDLFVFPSYSEGLPYTILEALASGTPVVATTVGAIPEVIEEGIQGLFVGTRDAEGLASAIGSLLNDRNRLRSMSNAAIKRAHSHYGVRRLANQLDQLYEGLLE